LPKLTNRPLDKSRNQINHSEQILLSRQQQPHHRGDDREQIIRARQAAEALFTSKPPLSPPAIALPALADPSARKPRVLQIIPPPAPARYDEPDAPAAPTPPAVEIPPAQIARIRTWIKYGMKVAQVARVYGVSAGEIERLLGKA
jgi:hypothetical protein